MAQIDDDAKARAERRKKCLEGDDADKKDERKAPAQIGAKQRGKNMTERADKLRDETIKKTEALLGTLPRRTRENRSSSSVSQRSSGRSLAISTSSPWTSFL